MYHSRLVENRKSQTHQWNPSDSEENYKPFQPNGLPNYSKEEIEYKFNSDGFRCDDFNEHSDLPILFLGCSITEGIGLHLKETWSSLLHTTISELPENAGKKIPYWSLALGGTGTDTAARELFNYYEILKPKHIFYMHISMYRRDLCLGDDELELWLPNFSNNKIVERIFTDELYAWHQSYKNYCLMNVIAKQLNTTVHVFNISNEISSCQSSRALRSLSNIKIVNVNTLQFKQIDPGSIERPMARDNIHSGPYWHRQNCQMILDYLTRNNVQLT